MAGSRLMGKSTNFGGLEAPYDKPPSKLQCCIFNQKLIYNSMNIVSVCFLLDLCLRSPVFLKEKWNHLRAPAKQSRQDCQTLSLPRLSTRGGSGGD